MRKITVAANWKMFGSLELINQFATEFLPRLRAQETGGECEVVFYPPALYVRPMIRKFKGANVLVGGQTCHDQVEGAYTGEIAARQLADIGATRVLVGHSERRTLGGESDELVAAKFAAAIEAKLHPTLCVGETLAEREANTAKSVVSRQLNTVVAAVGIDKFVNATVAYEPVWAIGTGKTATPAMAQEMHGLIRQLLTGHDAAIGADTGILYGGSVNKDNAIDLFGEQDIDGGLVGGASLTPDAFWGIVETVGK